MHITYLDVFAVLMSFGNMRDPGIDTNFAVLAQ